MPMVSTSCPSVSTRPNLLLTSLASLACLGLLASASGQEHIDVAHVLEGQAGDSLGLAVGGLGDVDADGRDDFSVMSGLVIEIRSGADAALLRSHLLPPWEIGHRPAVSRVGDVDHDGHDDYAISDAGSDVACSDCGTVRVHSGLDGGVLLTLHGSSNERAFGAALASAGDVDGDGTPDLVVGAPDRSLPLSFVPGAILIYSGADGSLLREFLCSGCAPPGITAYDHFGAVLANAGDVDADGIDDIVATYTSAYLFAYVDGFFTVVLENGARVVSGLDGSLLQQQADADYPSSAQRVVSGLGDLDGDGYADYAVSDGVDSVIVRSGATGGQLAVLAGTGPHFGDGLSAAGDVDCDGVGDILVVDASDPPVAHVHSGRDFIRLASLPLTGGYSFSASGRTAALVGDANGDGRPDLIVGDPLHGSPTRPAGAVTVFSIGTGSAEPYGHACAGSGGYAPVLAVSGCHLVQGSVGLEISSGPGGALALLLPSLGPGSTTIGGCELLVDLGVAGPGLFLLLGGTGPGQGSATLTGLVPPGFPVGTPIYLQALVLDGASPAGWVGSNGVAWTLDELPGSGLPQTWWVDDDAVGPGTGTVEDPFREIRSALDAAVHHDTILVRDGYYTGPGNRELSFGGKQLTLRSTGGPTACTVDGAGAGTVFVFDQGETHASVLSGFTITGGQGGAQGGRGGGIDVVNSGPSIRNCLITGNAANRGGGLRIAAGNPRLENCEIRDNTADETSSSPTALAGGIYCESAAATIRNCTIRGNLVAHGGSSGGAGLYLQDSAETLVTSSIVRQNDAVGVSSFLDDLWVSSGDDPTIEYSNVGGLAPGSGVGNIAGNPGFLPLGPDGISHLGRTSPCIDAGDPAYLAAPGETDIDGEPRVAGGRVDIGADEVP